MALGTSIHLKQSSKLSPQQIQVMKLLQIPTSLLLQRIEEEIEVNPALEEGGDLLDDQYAVDEAEEFPTLNEEEAPFDDFNFEEAERPERDDLYELDGYLDDYMDDEPSYKTQGDAYNPEEEDKRELPFAFESTFIEYVQEQVNLLALTDQEKLIASQIVGSLNEDGYLSRDPKMMSADFYLSYQLKISEAEIIDVLTKIQQLEPAGVAARDLRECLLLQIRAKIRSDLYTDGDKYYLKIAERILNLMFDEFTKKHFEKMQRQLGIKNPEDLKSAMEEIRQLAPKPANTYGGSQDRAMQYIIPDFIVENEDGVVGLRVDQRNIPDLRISDQYKDMLSAYKVSRTTGRSDRKAQEAVLFIKQKIDSAKWFIDAIKQREHTMMKTMMAILEYQYEFFLTGDEKKIKPMILKDVAEATQLDISTVSRVANSKFVQTEFGTKRLKDFFSESLQTESGEEVSTLEVKKILTDIIGAENKRKPYSDEKLKFLLHKKGYNIARRTVAKYREQLNVPVARLRKTM
jgi:RNA polymerase sigma-54 factor